MNQPSNDRDKKIQVPKIRIRPARPSQNNETLEAALTQLQNAIHEIYHLRQSKLRFEECYRNAYTLVRAGRGALLHSSVLKSMSSNLDDLLEIHISPFQISNFSEKLTENPIRVSSPSFAIDEVIPSSFPFKRLSTLDSNSLNQISSAQNQEDSSFLRALSLVWERHLICLPKISSILVYMDTHFMEHPNETCKPLMQAGPEQFYLKVIKGGEWIEKRLISSVLGQMALERNGNMADRGAVKSITSMLLLLDDGIYDNVLEAPFLESSQNFYSKEASSLMQEATSSAFLEKVSDRFIEEKERCEGYLFHGTFPKVSQIINEEMIIPYTQLLAEKPESGLHSMLEKDSYKAINRMYTLFKNSGSQEALLPFRKIIKDFYFNQGLTILSSLKESNPGKPLPGLEWVKSVILLKQRWDQIYKKGLESDRSFQASVAESFSGFINQFSQAPEFLSLYLDEHMRSLASGKAEETETESIQSMAIILFRYLQDKDMFEGYYRSHLARRMLMGSRGPMGGRTGLGSGMELPAEDSERGMIHKLRLECGCGFTAKLEGMFKDIGTASDTALAFRQHAETSVRNMPMDLHVIVLTSSSWPLKPPKPCILPPEAEQAFEMYNSFYQHLHSGRKLTWMTHLGTAEIKAQFQSKKYDLIANTYQMIIICLFNSSSNENSSITLSFDKISSLTGINEYELRRHLHSLSAAKYNLLLKTTPGKNISVTDEFCLNNSFKSPTFRIKLPIPKAQLDPEDLHNGNAGPNSESKDGDNEADRRATQAEVETARGYQIEASIIRVMKTRRRLNHALLVAEVTTHLQSRFQPDPISIKKKVESLIDREFLERLEGDMNMYHYLA